MSKIYFTLMLMILGFGMNAQIVITEIMYNPPESGQDSLEYIEIHNSGDQAVNLEGYTFVEGIQYTFPAMMFEPGDYLVIAVDTTALKVTLGITEAVQWESGGLSNGGEDIEIRDAQGNQVDIVDYQNGGDWPSAANGEGSSLELCDPARDNNMGSNWKASSSAKGIVINGNEVKGTPDAENKVSCADHTIMVTSNVFTPDSLVIQAGETVEWICTEGRHNVNGSAATFPANPEGFSSGSPEVAPWAYTYTFTVEGNYDYQCDPHVFLGMTGFIEVQQAVPVADIVITEIMYNNPGSDTLEFLELYNNSDQPVDLTGYEFVNGITANLDGETIGANSYMVLAAFPGYVIDSFGVPALEYTGSLNNNGEAIELVDDQGRSVDRVVYDNTSPWNPLADGNGYSLILCDINADNSVATNWDVSDVSTGLVLGGRSIFCNPGKPDECVEVGEKYPLYNIATVTTVDALGFPDSILVTCAVQGIVHGVDLQGNNNIQFTIIDQTGGMGVFSTNNFNYTVNEGDELLLKGVIVQFNGLTQMNPDSLKVINTGGSPFAPRVVNDLDESTESEVIQINNVRLIDPSRWPGDGSSFTIDVTNGTKAYSVRIDDDTELANQTAPMGNFNLSGIGGQFDPDEPYTEGYQILPRYNADIDFINSAEDMILQEISLHPNPVKEQLIIQGYRSDVLYQVIASDGRMVMNGKDNQINVSLLPPGVYQMKLILDDAQAIRRFVKQ